MVPPHFPLPANLVDGSGEGTITTRKQPKNVLHYIDEVLAETLAKIVQKSGFASVRVQQHKILHPDLVPGGQRTFHVQANVLPPRFFSLQETEHASSAHALNSIAHLMWK